MTRLQTHVFLAQPALECRVRISPRQTKRHGFHNSSKTCPFNSGTTFAKHVFKHIARLPKQRRHTLTCYALTVHTLRDYTVECGRNAKNVWSLAKRGPGGMRNLKQNNNTNVWRKLDQRIKSPSMFAP